jgi:RNA polymerase sigma-70 factor (ECF subfamily)
MRSPEGNNPMAESSEGAPDTVQALKGDAASFEALADEELVDLFVECSRTSDRQQAHLCFEALMARYEWLVNHIVRGSRFRFPAWDSADDVVSRVIFKIYRGLSRWRGEGKLSSFIARIATSELIDTIRRVGRDRSWDQAIRCPDDPDLPSAIDVAASPEPSPEAVTADRERRNVIRRLLGDVCRDWKDSVIVNEYITNSMAAKEISEKYGISEDLVYQRARRLRVRLVKWLADRGITSAEQLLGGAGASVI